MLILTLDLASWNCIKQKEFLSGFDSSLENPHHETNELVYAVSDWLALAADIFLPH